MESAASAAIKLALKEVYSRFENAKENAKAAKRQAVLPRVVVQQLVPKVGKTDEAERLQFKAILNDIARILDDIKQHDNNRLKGQGAAPWSANKNREKLAVLYLDLGLMLAVSTWATQRHHQSSRAPNGVLALRPAVVRSRERGSTVAAGTSGLATQVACATGTLSERAHCVSVRCCANVCAA
jgi:hypothetical protein